MNRDEQFEQGLRMLVGRGYEGLYTHQRAAYDAADPKLAPFALYITPQKHFGIRFCDVDGRNHTATCATVTVEENQFSFNRQRVDDGKIYATE